jgi:hypothetical protein
LLLSLFIRSHFVLGVISINLFIFLCQGVLQLLNAYEVGALLYLFLIAFELLIIVVVDLLESCDLLLHEHLHVLIIVTPLDVVILGSLLYYGRLHLVVDILGLVFVSFLFGEAAHALVVVYACELVIRFTAITLLEVLSDLIGIIKQVLDIELCVLIFASPVIL